MNLFQIPQKTQRNTFFSIRFTHKHKIIDSSQSRQKLACPDLQRAAHCASASEGACRTKTTQVHYKKNKFLATL